MRTEKRLVHPAAGGVSTGSARQGAKAAVGTRRNPSRPSGGPQGPSLSGPRDFLAYSREGREIARAVDGFIAEAIANGGARRWLERPCCGGAAHAGSARRFRF